MGNLYGDETGPNMKYLYELFKEVTPLEREAWYQEKFCCLQNVYANGFPEDLGRRVFLTYLCFKDEFFAVLKSWMGCLPLWDASYYTLILRSI